MCNRSKLHAMLWLLGVTLFVPHALGQGLLWTRSTASAAWPVREIFSATVYNGRMWVLGGRTNSGTLLNDVWYSTHGSTWQIAASSAAWPARYGLAAVSHAGRLWIMAGNVSGTHQKDVWYSTNGANWTQATSAAPWIERYVQAATVFDARIWITGGISGGSVRSDVWQSPDGLSWTQATATAAWGIRFDHALIPHEGAMWVLGGNIDTNLVNDVWRSTDGATWTSITSAAPWALRSHHTSASFAGRMWVMGGYGGSGGLNDVWSSTDGVTWTATADLANWSQRYSHASVVFDDKVWVMGGNDVSRLNDVWFGAVDSDNDGVNDAIDNCPDDANPGQEDADGDGAGDACDACPNDPNKVSLGVCGCGVSDDDSDSDGVADCNDVCPGADDSVDCDTNGTPDCAEIAAGTGSDCTSNGILDACEAATWIGLDGRSFDDPANWTPYGIPLSGASMLNSTAIDNRAVLRSPGDVAMCNLMIGSTGSGREFLTIAAGARLELLDSLTLTHGGNIDLQGGELAGGIVTNTGDSISGFGIVSADVDNLGRIEGRADINDNLVFSGSAFENEPAGLVRARPGSSVLVRSTTLVQSGTIEVRPAALASFDSALVNSSEGGITLLDGVLAASGVANEPGGTIDGFGTIDGDTLNDGEITAYADTQIVGNLTNNGTITIQSGVLTVVGNLSGSGSIIGGFGGRGGDPCGGLVINGSYILGENATLRLGCGVLKLGGNFDVAINDSERFDMTEATLQMAGLSGTQLLETLADDDGTCATLPEPTLFSIGTLRIGPTPTTVKLVDNHVNSVGGPSDSEVLYVGQLIIETGARLDLGGKRLYYTNSTPADPSSRIFDSIGGGAAVRLGGGGALPGDVNGDCKVDFDDVAPFIQVLLGLDAIPSHVAAADVDHSGQANGGDCAAFATTLLAP